jgi:hypothetical protein
MEKIESVYLQPQNNGKWSVINVGDGQVIDTDVSMGINLIRSLASRVKSVFVEHAYHILACHGMLDLRQEVGIRYATMDDNLPLVIMQDPPTIACYLVGSNAITVVDPANYGMIMSNEFPVQQLTAYRSLLSCPYMPSTAVSMAKWLLEQRCDVPVELQTHGEKYSGPPISSMPMGGRCGAAYYGRCPGNAFHHYDIQGAYLGAAMLSMPIRCLGSSDSEKLPERAYECVASVTIMTDLPLYPYRPANDDTRSRRLTYYPEGSFRTVLCGKELYSALSNGHVAKVHGWSLWQCGPWLRPYAADMIINVARCHPSIRSAVKTTALAGLGWFARKVKIWEESESVPPHPDYCGDYYRLEDDGVRRYRAISGSVMRECVGGYHAASAPQVWAWIASAVRDRLSGVLRELGRHAMYWDTDSVITNSRGAAIMERRHDFGIPGGWQKKGNARTMHVWGYRRYSFGDELHIGLPVSAQDEAGGRAIWESPETWDEAMGNRHYPDGSLVTRSARIRGTYDHGRICEDGRIVPWHIDADSGIDTDSGIGLPGD